MEMKYVLNAALSIAICGCVSHSTLSSIPSNYQSEIGATSIHYLVAPGGHSSTGGKVELGQLIRGNLRFVTGESEHRHQDVARRRSLASGQTPGTIVLSCSDSRVPPEVVFDKGLGELFVVRTAGEIADEAALASIEYGVEHLKAKLLVVMGHSSCGAVKAALTTPEGKSAGSEHLDSLLSKIRPAVSQFKLEVSDKTFEEPVKSNVHRVAKGLSSRSEIIRHAIHSGELMIVEGIYRLDTGKVDFWY